MFDISKKTIATAAIGNIFEVYDYATWVYFAIYLSHEFLPKSSELSNIFFLFLISYLFRPLGSVICGILADLYGRKKILIFSIILMGLCTSIIAILPPYSIIGIFSLFFLMLIRLTQALTFGGGYISSISLLIESCDSNRKGYFGSWAAVGANFGILLASLIGTSVTYFITDKMLPEWAWRLAFLFAAFTTFVAYWISQSTPESFEFIINKSQQEKNLSKLISESCQALKIQCFDSLLVFILVWFGTALSFLIFVYIPLYLSNSNYLETFQVFIINSFSLIILIIIIPGFGFLSDKFGRVQTISAGIVCVIGFLYPYVLNLSSGSMYRIFIAQIIMAIPCACIFAVTPVLITEIFPISVRCTTANILYSTAACLGIGFTPVIALNCSTKLYGNYLPIYLLILPAAISLVLLVVFYRKNYKSNFN